LLAPLDGRTSFNRGNSSCSKGDYVGAISDYTRAIELDPRHANA
jgi:Tetratricopeptide repeat